MHARIWSASSTRAYWGGGTAIRCAIYRSPSSSLREIAWLTAMSFAVVCIYITVILYISCSVQSCQPSSIISSLATMKTFILATLASQVCGHAIWQDLWVNGVDKGNTCARLPGTSYVSNSPVTVSEEVTHSHEAKLIHISTQIERNLE